MLAYASYHRRGVCRRRNRPLICFPCFEIVASASNLLITVAGSISTPSLSVGGKLGKLPPFPPDSVGFAWITPHLSCCWHRRNGLPVPLQADVGYYGSSVTMQEDALPVYVIPSFQQVDMQRASGVLFVLSAPLIRPLSPS